jgi:hypothetical protein
MYYYDGKFTVYFIFFITGTTTALVLWSAMMGASVVGPVAAAMVDAGTETETSQFRDRLVLAF